MFTRFFKNVHDLFRENSKDVSKPVAEVTLRVTDDMKFEISMNWKDPDIMGKLLFSVAEGHLLESILETLDNDEVEAALMDEYNAAFGLEEDDDSEFVDEVPYIKPSEVFNVGNSGDSLQDE